MPWWTWACTVTGWLTPQLSGAQVSSGTNRSGISASNMLPPHDGVTSVPLYG